MDSSPVSIDVNRFRRDGYLRVSAVFEPEEIESLRARCAEHAAHRGDLLSHPGLSGVVTDPRLVAIARTLLGATPVYFGDSCHVIGAQSHGFHKDNADRDDPNAPDWRSPYTLIRFGLYLQDHRRHSGGLVVRRGSHRVPDDRTGRIVYVRSRPGDVVVWNLRTTHGGNGVLLRAPVRVAVHPHRDHRVPSWLRAPEEKKRMALFFTVGIDDGHLARYLQYVKTRRYMVETWRHSTWSEEALARARAVGLDVRPVWESLLAEAGLGVNEGYVPIPY